MNSNIRAVIFDFAGVIGSDGYWLWLKANDPLLEEHREALHAESVRVDRGEISGDEFLRNIGSIVGRDPEEVKSGFLSLVKIDPEVVQVIQELKNKFKIGLLSNFMSDWLSEILTRENLNQLFDAQIISSAHGVVKPEQAAFDKILTGLNVSANEAIFIDDRQMHVDGGRRAGIVSVLFTSAQELRQDLRDIGVLERELTP